MIKEIMSAHLRNDYQRQNFDSFLKKVGFGYKRPTIHIAGTNGKGSTAKYIASIYKSAGYKVGLFCSPYLNEINEMISINDQIISDDEFVSIYEEYAKIIKKYNLSEFEVETFICFVYFERNNVDIAVVECGMGGELDATNIYDSILCIITSVSLEHTNFLGRSVSEITQQKCGIFRPMVPVLIGDLAEESKTVVVSECRLNKCELFVVEKPNNVSNTWDGSIFSYLSYKNIKIKSPANYSVFDACLAIKACLILASQFPIKDEHIYNGLSNVTMPCRFDVISKKPLIIIDGGHNPEAVENLVKSLQNLDNFAQIHTIIACFKDKNIENILNTIAVESSSLTLTTFDHPRARKEEDYFLYLNDYKFEENHIDLINKIIAENPEDIILITGSLAFAALVEREFKDGILKK